MTRAIDTDTDTPTVTRRRDHLLVALGGLALLGLAALGARDGTVSGPERDVFHAINDLPKWLYRGMWVFQQFGNLLVAFVLVVAVALVLRRRAVAAGALAAVVLKLGLERAVKQVVERRRPGTSIGDVVLRGDVSAGGLSFVSGHATITAAMATILTPVLPGRWKLVPWLVVALNGLARVYVGAHNPLDIVGGVGLGLFIGGLVNLVIAPHRRRAAAGDATGAGPAPPAGSAPEPAPAGYSTT